MSGIRIQGGEARGRQLKTFKIEDLSVRPLLGRIKKSLFDIIRPKLAGADFLDLFAGTGAVGIEALSQGARRAVFVELSPRSLALIKENIESLGWSGRADIHRADVTKGLGWIKGPFGVIFLGPPYKDDRKRPLALTTPALRAVVEAGLLAKDGIIVSQRHDKEAVNVPGELAQYRQEKYGDTILSFYRRNEE